MNRKWAALGGTLTTAVLCAAFATFAQDENDSPLLKVMKQVQVENAKIVTGVRNPAMYKKSQTVVAKSADALVKLLKQAKPFGKEVVDGPHNEKKKTITDWNKLADDCLKDTTGFAELVTKPATSQAEAKKDFAKVTKACTACHEDFRVEE